MFSFSMEISQKMRLIWVSQDHLSLSIPHPSKTAVIQVGDTVKRSTQLPQVSFHSVK